MSTDEEKARADALLKRLHADRAAQIERCRAPKRKAEEPTEDGSREPLLEPPTTTTGGASSSAPAPSGQKRKADEPPDDPRLPTDGDDSPDVVTDIVANADVDHGKKRYARTCATCECTFATRNQLHRHIRKRGHQRLGPPPGFQEEMRGHYGMAGKPTGCDIGSVMELPPGADEAGSRQLQTQHAHGQIAGQPKPLDSMGKGHPGPRIPTHKIAARDQQWHDIGSGIVARTFKQVSK